MMLPLKIFLKTISNYFFYVVKRSEKGYLLTERLAESKIDIDEAAAAALPDGRALLQSRGNPAPAVRVTHFLKEMLFAVVFHQVKVQDFLF